MLLSTATIGGIWFYPLSAKDIELQSYVRITESDILGPDGMPATNGVYSAKMGTTMTKYPCESCEQKKDKCPGHPGHVDLPCAVMNTVFTLHVTNWLRVTCHRCSSLMRTAEEMKAKGIRTLSQLKEYCMKGGDKCPNCKAIHPHIDKADKMGIIKINTMVEAETAGVKKRMERAGGKSQFLYPYQVLRILQNVTDESIKLLNIPPQCHPRNYVVTKVVAMPVTMRPTIVSTDGPAINNNNATTLLQNIVEKSKEITEAEIISLGDSAPRDDLVKKMLELNAAVAAYMFIEKPIVPGYKNTRQTMPPSKMLGKKKGYIRGNATGKRVFNVSRAFIVGDPTMPLDHIGIPMETAMSIYLPRTVTRDNYAEMEIYYKNGPKKWPGAKTVKTKECTKNVSFINQGKYTLQEGDVLYTHVLNEDIVGFNRQPSLLPSSVAAMKVKVLAGTKVIRFNEVICNLFNADFDGDAMLVIFVQSSGARSEMELLANPRQFFKSLQTGDPTMGLLLDSLVGMVDLTSCPAISKRTAMSLFAGTSAAPDFTKVPDIIHGRDVVTMYLQEKEYIIDMKTTATFYDKNYEKFIDYNPDDVNVVIKKGKVISGILDNAAVGQGQRGSIFHIIANTYGVDEAQRAVYDLQQIAIAYSTCRYSITLRDMLVNRETLKKLHNIQVEKYDEIIRLCHLFDEGGVTPPVGMTLRQYFNQRVIDEMKTDKWGFVLRDMFPHNNLLKSFIHGIKGKINNIRSIVADVGLVAPKGNLVANKMTGRQSPYMLKDDNSAEAFGYSPNSYIVGNGIGPTFIQYVDGRITIVDKALTTADAGDAGRKSARRAEDIKVNTLMQTEGSHGVLSLMYGVDTADPRKSQRVELDMMKVSDDEFKKWKIDAKEFEMLDELRSKFAMISEEIRQIGYKGFGPDMAVPVNPKFVIESVRRLNSSGFDSGSAKEYVSRVDRLITDIEYSLFSKAFRAAGKKIPSYVTAGLYYQILAIRNWLSLRKLKDYDIDLATLDLICNEVVCKFVDSHMSAGAAIGVISSQSLAQPLTQMILNSIHSAKAGGGVDRYREISNMKPTSAMKAPMMYIELNEEYEQDRAKVLSFAKNLEHIFFADIILGVEMRHEAPLKPTRKEDASIITEYLRYSGSKAPEDLANYSIRLKIDKYKLVEKYVDMETVMKAVYRAHPGVYMAYRDDNSSEVVVYVYCRVGSLPKGEALDKIQKLYDLLRNTLIRGVDGIIRADVKEGVRIGSADSKKDKVKYHYIETLGTNLRAMLMRPEVRKRTLMSNSIVETYEVYGVLAAKNKIITEMAAQVPGVSIKHIMTMVSLVTFRGELDPLNRFGNIKGGGSVLMSLVDGAPQQILRTAGTNGLSDKVNTVAGSLLLSQPPEIGSFYSTLVVNEKFVRDNTANVEELLEQI